MTHSEPKTSSTSLWNDGWYRFARPLPSPNYGERPKGTVIDMVVMHNISLPPQQFGCGNVQQFFLNQLQTDTHPYFQEIAGLEVSAHFYIERDGKLWQFVSCEKRAWHAGQSQWKARENCNDFSIGIELEGCDDIPFDPLQYASLNALIPAISAAYPISEWVGHSDIAPGRKTDPGEYFDWDFVKRIT